VNNSTPTLDQLEGADAGTVLSRLAESDPVVWVPAIDGWLVTGRSAAIEVLRDAERFTVDDPRFTTAQVVGPSMLSLDGAEHRRHRAPFVEPFRPSKLRVRLEAQVNRLAAELVRSLRPRGRANLRTELAGPLAVSIIADALGLVDCDESELLGWYRAIVDGVDRLSTGRALSTESLPAETLSAVAALRSQVEATLAERKRTPGPGLPMYATGDPAGDLTTDEVFSNTAVVLFGAIETGEGMISNALFHLLSHPTQLAEVRADQNLVGRAIEESLRLEPAAAVVDRYATSDAQLGTGGQVSIKAGDLVRVSLTGANRDPNHFEQANQFDIHRPTTDHLSFVQGPHACIGAHLARLETSATLRAALAGLPDLAIDRAQSTPPTGLVFRKPDRLIARWSPQREAVPVVEPSASAREIGRRRAG
jgi:cytochrome P450